ncbi:MAG: hypothetical protein AAGA91_18075, partial [Pseudomonadota bacterium]
MVAVRQTSGAPVNPQVSPCLLRPCTAISSGDGSTEESTDRRRRTVFPNLAAHFCELHHMLLEKGFSFRELDHLYLKVIVFLFK